MKVTLNLSSDALYTTLIALEEYRDSYAKKNNVQKRWTDAADEAYKELKAITEKSCYCCCDCKHYSREKKIGGNSYCNTKRIIVESYKNDCDEWQA